MTATTQAIRDALPTAFEQHYAIKFDMTKDLDGEFSSVRTRMMQRAWDAATLAERERCAVLCESISAEDGIGSYKHEDDYAVGAVNALTRAAIEIREGVKS